MERSLIVLIPALGFVFLLSIGGAQGMPIIGDNVGIISATVAKGDSERGLTVRSSPSAESQPRAYLPTGTRVKGYPMFKNGYVKIEDPHRGGWIRLDSLQPIGGEATVASVDRPDLCLRIRSGPANSYDKVGCVELGQKLELTGFWSQNNWAQVSGPASGWVNAGQISSVLKPSSAGQEMRTSKEEPTPIVVREVPVRKYQDEWRPHRHYYGQYDPYSRWGGVGVNINIGKGKNK